MKTEPEKKHVPIGHFERQTSHCPLYVAWVVLDEARDYFRTEIPETYAAALAQRAEGVFANHPFWQRRFQSAAGREYLLSVMRHWLAGVLAKEQPALFRDLPDSYKVGHPLPCRPVAAVCDRRSRSNFKARRSQSAATTAKLHFVHGCELLAV
jgi:hypothetical protein